VITQLQLINIIIIIIIIIIVISGSTVLDGPWPPQGYHQAVCITAITIIVQVNVKVKQSRYRPGVAQSVPGSYDSQIS